MFSYLLSARGGVFFLAAITCLAARVPPLAAAEAQVSEDVMSLARSNRQFALDLYARLRSNGAENLFFSPVSISTALAMTYAGAAGQTRDEMAGTLRFDLAEERVHRALAALIETLGETENNAYELNIANRLWGQQDFDFRGEFLETTRQQYGAELAQVDFVRQADAVRQQINRWVEERTRGKIQDLIPAGALDHLTRLVLTNAIYFKGQWAHPFDEGATREAAFHAPGREIQVPMMYQKEHFRYGEHADLQVLEMPYAGEHLSMVILLPKSVDGLGEFEERLTMENLDRWLKLGRREVEVYLPRFQLTSEFQLNAALAQMGMPSAFDPDTADFSRMSDQDDLYLTAALHKAFVEVTEEGTEAAAATGIVVGVTALPPPPVVFRADRPFVFLIRDNRTNSILFLGRLTNPSDG